MRRFALPPSLHAGLEIWRRLRWWVRWLCGALLVVLFALSAFTLVGRKAPPAPAVSVKLAGPPAVAEQKPVDPALLARLVADRTPLSPAPIEALQVATPNGMLPRTATDRQGRLLTPLRAYAHPSAPVPAGAKQLAVIVLEAGLVQRNTQAALALPGAVTLAFDAGSDELATQIAAARAAGHEVMLDVPMQPLINSDLGPDTLMAGQPALAAVKQLQTMLARAPGAVALLSRNGDTLVANSAALWPLLQELALRGLGWVSLGAAGDLSTAVAAKVKLPAAEAMPLLDAESDPVAMRQAYDTLLEQLDTTRQAIIVVPSYPGILQLLNTWLQDLPNRGIALVPASQLLKPGS